MNVRKHAQASAVEVTVMASGGRYVVRVRDDGVGFDVAKALRARPGHVGLAALNERLRARGRRPPSGKRSWRGHDRRVEVPAGIPHSDDAP